ncbi:MAG TPA: hypothetical protein VNE59_03690 [Burkholderiales bacterium]|nr:hypothetical protein [Burkholderiales bacterium]
MATIVILEHALQRSLRLPYLVYGLAERWRRDGHRVIVHHGLDAPPAGDLAIVNIDLTVIPAAYRALYARYAKVLNGAVLDVSKRRYSLDLLDRYSDWVGAVIVKTDANFGGRPEALLRSVAVAEGSSCDIPAGPLAQGYPIYRSLREVPAAVWTTPGLIVERFLPERDARGDYYLRTWMFLGDRDRSTRWRATGPIVKADNTLERVPAEVPDEIRAWRERLGFDFGKFDFVRHGERWVLLDVNRTPAYPPWVPGVPDPALDTLAPGLRSYLG